MLLYGIQVELFVSLSVVFTVFKGPIQVKTSHILFI